MRKILIGTALIAVFSMIVSDSDASSRRGVKSTDTTTGAGTGKSTAGTNTGFDGVKAVAGTVTEYSAFTKGGKEEKEVVAEVKLCFPNIAEQGTALLKASDLYVKAWKKEDTARKAALESIRNTITNGTGKNEELDFKIDHIDNSELYLAADSIGKAVKLIVKGAKKRTISDAYSYAQSTAHLDMVKKAMSETEKLFRMADDGKLAAADMKKISAWRTAFNEAKSSAPQKAVYLRRTTSGDGLATGQGKAAMEMMGLAENYWDAVRSGTVAEFGGVQAEAKVSYSAKGGRTSR